MTIEELQAENLRLAEENAALVSERDAAQRDLAESREELERVRTVNQEFYLKLRAQKTDEPDEPGEPEEPQHVSCEELARTLDI